MWVNGSSVDYRRRRARAEPKQANEESASAEMELATREVSEEVDGEQPERGAGSIIIEPL